MSINGIASAFLILAAYGFIVVGIVTTLICAFVAINMRTLDRYDYLALTLIGCFGIAISSVGLNIVY